MPKFTPHIFTVPNTQTEFNAHREYQVLIDFDPTISSRHFEAFPEFRGLPNVRADQRAVFFDDEAFITVLNADQKKEKTRFTFRFHIVPSPVIPKAKEALPLEKQKEIQDKEREEYLDNVKKMGLGCIFYVIDYIPIVLEDAKF